MNLLPTFFGLLKGAPQRQAWPIHRSRQGATARRSISPMLFIIAIDQLHHLFRLALEEGILRPFRARPMRFTVSLYADDAGIFVGTEVQDMRAARQILQRPLEMHLGCTLTSRNWRPSPLAARRSRLCNFGYLPDKEILLSFHLPRPSSSPLPAQSDPLPSAY